jgi:hypothetical protein
MAESTDRSLQQTAQQGAKTAQQVGGQYGNQAGQVGAQLVPTLERDINNPTGYTPSQSNAMLVAGEQGAGGATAGVTGQAGLNAMRTRNSGAMSGVLDQAARTRGQTLSENALNVQNQSARLAQSKRADALRQLQGIYGTDVSAQLGAMGQVAPDVNAGVNAGQVGWLQNTEGILKALGELGGGVGAAAKGFG